MIPTDHLRNIEILSIAFTFHWKIFKKINIYTSDYLKLNINITADLCIFRKIINRAEYVI